MNVNINYAVLSIDNNCVLCIIILLLLDVNAAYMYCWLRKNFRIQLQETFLEQQTLRILRNTRADPNTKQCVNKLLCFSREVRFSSASKFRFSI